MSTRFDRKAISANIARQVLTRHHIQQLDPGNHLLRDPMPTFNRNDRLQAIRDNGFWSDLGPLPGL